MRVHRSFASALVLLALCAGSTPAGAQTPPPLPPGAVQPPPLERTAQREIWVAIGGRPVGPLSLEEVRRRAAAGELTAQTLAWKPGMSGWTPLGQLPEFADLFARIWIAEGGQSRGPFAPQEIDRLVREGRLTADTLVWREGWPTWKRAGEDPELVARLRAASGVGTGGVARQPVSVPDTPETRRRAARAYIEAAGFESMWRQMLEQTAQQLLPDPTAMEDPEVARVLARMLELLIGTEWLKKTLEDGLVEHFTAEELQALAEFYGSEVGRRIGEKMPKFTAQLLPVALQRIEERSQDPQVQKELAALKSRLDRLVGGGGEEGLPESGPPSGDGDTDHGANPAPAGE